MPKKSSTSPTPPNVTDRNHLIIFDQQDDPRAHEILRAALDQAAIAPVLGLVIKVREGAGGEQVVNWMFTDADHIKYLALSVQEEKKTNQPGVTKQ